MSANTYPLVFAFRDAIVGKGFVADVAVQGRVLLTDEADGDVWMFGVQPGGVAGGGGNRSEAFHEFKKSYLSVLFDSAVECASFADFESDVKRFFSEVNAPNEKVWLNALAAVREGKLSLPNLGSTNADLWLPSIEIRHIDQQASPSANAFDMIREAA